MTKQGEETEPEAGPDVSAVLKTEGEDVARAYVASAVPEGGEHPTIEVERVRIVAPTRTPTVRLGEMPKGSGPRAPEQMAKAEPKGPVELPDGRPVTKMQRIEVDSEFLIELARRRAEGEAGAGEQPPEEAAPMGPVSTPATVKKPAKRPVLMVVAIAATAGVVAVVAMRPVRAPAPSTRPEPSATVLAVPSATVPSAAVVVTPPAPPPSTVPVAPPPGSAPPHALERPHIAPKPSSVTDDPYGEPAPKPLPTTTAPAPPAISPPAPPATATSAPKPPAPPTPSEKPIYD